MKTSYFATRTIARNFATENGGKVKDFGKDAAAGERWAVLQEVSEVVPVVSTVELDEPTAQLAAALKAVHAVEVVKPSVNTTDRITFLNVDKIQNKIKVTANVVTEEVKKIVAGIIGEQTLKTPNNKPVRVLWRRNIMAMRLADSIAQTA